MVKIRGKVDIPLVLDLGPFMAGGEGQRRVIMRHVYILGYDSLCEERGCNSKSIRVAKAMVPAPEEASRHDEQTSAARAVGGCGARPEHEIETCRSYRMCNSSDRCSRTVTTKVKLL